MFRQCVANSKKRYVIKVSLVELNFFFCYTRHPPLKCQINHRHFYSSIFRVTNSDTSMYCATVVNFKLKVQIVSDL